MPLRYRAEYPTGLTLRVFRPSPPCFHVEQRAATRAKLVANLRDAVQGLAALHSRTLELQNASEVSTVRCNTIRCYAPSAVATARGRRALEDATCHCRDIRFSRRRNCGNSRETENVFYARQGRLGDSLCPFSLEKPFAHGGLPPERIPTKNLQLP